MMEKRMKELAAIIQEAKDAYYNDGESIMSDKEYDALEAELHALQQKYGTSDSELGLTVGAKVSGNRKRVTHEKPALSLDKTKDVNELLAWLGQNVGVLSWKMDGLTIVVSYQN